MAIYLAKLLIFFIVEICHLRLSDSDAGIIRGSIILGVKHNTACQPIKSVTVTLFTSVRELIKGQK